MKNNNDNHYKSIKSFYDLTYYKGAKSESTTTNHLRKLARKIGIKKGQKILDVACGIGEWLYACQELEAIPNGVDLSETAINICKEKFSEGEYYATPAESLPFENDNFDVISCLGSLEHFVEPSKALNEMVRVSKNNTKFIFLVPNSGFLTRKLRLFSGTFQVEAKEEVLSIEEWQKLFNQSNLMVERMWKDLHVLSWSWITLSKWYLTPIRLAQALALSVWPLKWQYQVYFQCRLKQAIKKG